MGKQENKWYLITLGDALNIKFESQRLSDWMKKQNPPMCCLQEIS